MEKNRGTKVLAILAICVAVAGMTIGFAAFSEVLKIEGAGEVKAANFKVVFDELGTAVKTGTAAEKIGGTPTIQNNGTKISNYQVELMTPGDSISYTFKIKNKGTFDAELSTISIAGVEGKPFVVSGGDATDQENVKKHLIYKLTYVDGAKAGQDLAVGDVIPKNENGVDGVVTVKLTLTYESFNDSSELPKESVTIDNLGIDLTYTQA